MGKFDVKNGVNIIAKRDKIPVLKRRKKQRKPLIEIVTYCSIVFKDNRRNIFFDQLLPDPEVRSSTTRCSLCKLTAKSNKPHRQNLFITQRGTVGRINALKRNFTTRVALDKLLIFFRLPIKIDDEMFHARKATPELTLETTRGAVATERFIFLASTLSFDPGERDTSPDLAYKKNPDTYFYRDRQR